jgi:hypothetical protein
MKSTETNYCRTATRFLSILCFTEEEKATEILFADRVRLLGPRLNLLGRERGYRRTFAVGLGERSRHPLGQALSA